MSDQTGAAGATSAVAATLRALDPTWCQEMLRANGFPGVVVTEATTEQMDIAGAVADIARVRLSYEAAGPAGPPTAIAKIRATDEQRVGIDRAMGLYNREARFYAGFAGRSPLKSPRCYGVGDGTTTPLLIEDLSGLREGDQVSGLSVADAERVMDALADQHAAFWDSAECDEDWLASPTEGVFAGMIVQLVASGVDSLAQRYGDRAPAEALGATQRLAPRWGEVLQACAQGPRTVIHNDCRLDNLFFDQDGSPVFVDWQTIGCSRGTQDVGNLLAGSMNVPELRQNWEGLLRRYHHRLTARGVRGYSWDECVAHYRQTILYPLGQGIALIGALDRGDSRGLADAALLRALQHCHDLDSFATIEGGQ